MENNPKERITLVWHGGEPLLLGIDYFNKAYEFQEKHVGENKHRIDHAIQSNMTLYNSEFGEIFKEMNITSVGTSFDPIPGIPGPGPNHNSKAYNQMFFP